MKALVIEKPLEITIKDVPFPKPGRGEVTIRVNSSGVCGSDVYIYTGQFPSSYPVIPGHEFSGVVVELGPDVSEPPVGTRVSVYPHIFCGECYFCRSGRALYCLRRGGVGSTRNGGFAEYVAVPKSNVFVISDKLNFSEGALLEPASCVAYALQRIQIALGDHVLIFGAGAIGIMYAQLVRHGNAASITLCDLESSRLEIARSLGVRGVVLADEKMDQTLREFAPLGFDVVIDATGITDVVEKGLSYVKTRGKMLCFGVCPPEDTFPLRPNELWARALEIHGSFGSIHNYDATQDLMENEVLKVEPLISHRVALEEVPEFIVPERRSKKKFLKVIVEM